jgi:GR25 family glycosyltransferase involved in LPS biosynthesis
MYQTFVINLDRRNDRLEFLDIPWKWERFSAVDGNKFEDRGNMKGHAGCYMSHIKLLELIYEIGTDITIVFEDDVELIKDIQERIFDVIVKLPDDWDLLYLGGWNLGEIKRFDTGIDVAENILTTHAYMIRRKFIPIILAQLKTREFKIDVMFSESLKLGKCYICNPVLAWQRKGFSDIVNKITDNIHLR